MLNPCGNRRMIHMQTAFQHHLLEFPIAERIPQIPSNTKENDIGLEVTPLKGLWLWLLMEGTSFALFSSLYQISFSLQHNLRGDALSSADRSAYREVWVLQKSHAHPQHGDGRVNSNKNVTERVILKTVHSNENVTGGSEGARRPAREQGPVPPRFPRNFLPCLLLSAD